MPKRPFGATPEGKKEFVGLIDGVRECFSIGFNGYPPLRQYVI